MVITIGYFQITRCGYSVAFKVNIKLFCRNAEYRKQFYPWTLSERQKDNDPKIKTVKALMFIGKYRLLQEASNKHS